MLDHFLEVTYRADSEAKEKRAFIESLKKLPMEDLAKLASGETTLDKLAHDMCGEGHQWLDHYKDTPLFEQALALEQAELQNQMAQQQNDLQHEGTKFYREGDKIRLQKRMLNLQLVQSQAQATAGAPLPPSPEAPAQGAGAPGAGAPNNEEAMGASNEQGVKVGGAPLWSKLASPKPKKEKTAAPNLGAIGSGIMGNLSRVTKAMPKGELMRAGIGAGVGALGGAMAGGPDHRLSGALGGAAALGVGSLAGGNIARAAQAGGGLTGATAMKGLADTGRQMKATGNAVVGGVKKGLRAGEAGAAGAAKVAPSGIPMGTPGSTGTQQAIPVPHTPSTDAIPLQRAAYNPQ